MANPGGLGTKFVSVNLNKSYGTASNRNPSYGSGSYGQAAASRARAGSHSSGGGGGGGGTGGGGGGMVVLSRPRSSQKAGPKLSVPPPLNLPSLRKEHERFDSSGSGSASAGGAGSSSATRPTSSGVGWTKPVTVTMQDNGGDNGTVDKFDQSLPAIDGVKGSSAYTPPSARLGGDGLPASLPGPSADKAAVLRGEDFPSLRAALPSGMSGTMQKQKDVSHQKHKQLSGDESAIGQRDRASVDSQVHMRPPGQSPHRTYGNGSNNNDSEIYGLGSSQTIRLARKQDEFFPAPLPLVRLNPRSDWADDERDTGHGFVDRGRDYGYSNSEAYWDREFDMPRSRVLPHKPAENLFQRWGKREDETGKTTSEVPRMDFSHRDVKTPSREGSLWRTSPLPKDGYDVQEVANGRNGVGGRPMDHNRDMGKENKCIPSRVGDYSRDGVVVNQEITSGRRDVLGQEGRHQWNHTAESSVSWVTDRNTREQYGNEQSNRYRGYGLQSSVLKSSFSSSGKGLPMNDPILNVGREKRAFANGERTYPPDAFMKDFGATSFDEQDPFSSGLVGVIKRKKDVVKGSDFHDPVRESFEAELERVQKMQEQERQRILEEQERAVEQARREEEERQRLIREEEEQRRRLEEAAREAAWRAEQERLEAIQRAEEQKIAREEEKRCMLLEEERRKQAAKQKLLELEARMAKRQTETAQDDSSAATIDDKGSTEVMEKDILRVADFDNWEDSERMVERIMTSGSSDSSGVVRSFELGHRSQSSRDGASGFVDRVKPANSWKRDVFDGGNNSSFLIQDQDNGHPSPRRDASVIGRAFPRKDFHGGAGYMPSRNHYRGGMQDTHNEDYLHSKGHKWNASGDGDPYSRSMETDSEFHENPSAKYGDVGWGQGRFRGNARSPYSERLSSDGDELYPYGRSRYSMRQPRVLPPPSLMPLPKTSFRGENDHPGPSTFMPYNHSSRNGSTMQTGYYSGQQERFEAPEIVDVQLQNTLTQEPKMDKDSNARCDSQSSLSVSSPPSSPTHLSHDDLDESGDSPVVSATEGKVIPISGSDSAFSNTMSAKDTVVAASSLISDADEDWTLENNEELQEQEEYDEDDDGYQEEDEVHEGDDENIDMTQEFEDLHIEEKDSLHMMENLVLGFDEGVEVGLPSDEFERSSANEEGTFRMSEVSVGIVEQERSVDGKQVDQSLHPLDRSPETSIGSSLRCIQEADKAIQDSVIQPITTDPHALPASDLLDSVDRSGGSGVCAQQVNPSSVKIVSADQTVMSTVPVGSSHTDLPVKLQFGLFSGPSLIPSPVPAIQIGSIQMPLHLHPSVNSSLTQVHQLQPPLFQFGQLRHTTPISQGIAPMAPQMSFLQPNVQVHFNMNQSSGGHLPFQPKQEGLTKNLIKDDVTSVSLDGGSNIKQKNVPQSSNADENKFMSERGYETGDRGKHYSGFENYRPSKGTTSKGLLHSEPLLSISSEKDSGAFKTQGPQSGFKAKRYAYVARNSGLRSSFPAPEASRSGSGGFQRRPQRTVQRTEFRIRENADNRSSSSGRDGVFVRSGSKKGLVPNKSPEQIVELESSSSVQQTNSDFRVDRKIEKETSKRIESNPHSVEVNLKRTIGSEEDVDAPLQSGIVRVFKQPGIEAPSDEDDFIQVRSKRQMLNDRREQREKEIKAKSRVMKAPRKLRSTTPSAVGSRSSNTMSVAFGGEAPNNPRSDFVVPEGRGLTNIEVSTGFSTVASQPLAPIGTPAMTSDAQAVKRPQNIKSLQTGANSVISDGGKDLGPGLMLETKNKVLNEVQTTLGSWGNAQINHQVMALTQTQLDEAMRPGRFDTHVASTGGHSSSVANAIMPSSILTKDKSFSSTASPVNSLLAGEKIQFGAVTSPTVLPPSGRTVSHGIRAPGSYRPDIQISHNLSANKDKHQSESCIHLEDCEAEAEAAASAVAVAAISSDELLGGGLGACSVSVSDAKSFGGADTNGVTGGVVGDQQSSSLSRAEESLSVALPADLSVETPPMSLWPPLPSPQNSSGPMLSHFPGGPSSPFPFYEMNPMLGGPIFAFGPHDESVGTQSQPQKNSVSGSGPLGAWQQFHSAPESFYGPPAGFPGPYLGPHGGISGVQGPPHMVVYNHFPVGQFGQVGLSFMGTTYIPSGKQPDWKHNHASSAAGNREGDINNINMGSGQRNPPSMASPVQHLAPPSQLLPMPSPLAMFDMSPFQNAPDMSVQGRWPHVPASPLHSVPLSMPLQPEAGVLNPQISHGHPPVDQLLTANRFSEPRMSTPSDSSRTFSVPTDSTATQFPDELGLVDSTSSSVAGASIQTDVKNTSTGSTVVHAAKSDGAQSGSSNHDAGHSANSFKTRSSLQKNLNSQQYSHSTGYGYQRSRTGFHGRNNSMGTEKSFPSKMKQIYVAKQTTSGTSSME